MNRLFALVVGVALVGLLVFGVIVFTSTPPAPLLPVASGNASPPAPMTPGGAAPATSAAQTPDDASAAASTAPAAPATTSPEAAARFDAWAKVLRDRGLTVASDSVTVRGDTLNVANFSLAGPAQLPSWRWSIETAQIFDQGDFHLQAAGKTQLTVTPLTGPAATWSGKADAFGVAIQPDSHGGLGKSLIIRLNGLSFAAAGDTAPMTLSDGQLRLILTGGNGLVPSGSKAALRVTDLVIPAAASSPLGSKLQSLTAELTLDHPLKSYLLSDALDFWKPGVAGGSRLGTISIDWGMLHFIGDGLLNINEIGRIGGALDGKVTDVLALLDAIGAADHSRQEALTDAYGPLLLEAGRSEDDGLPFRIGIDNGTVALKGDGHGIADILLGIVPRMITGANSNLAQPQAAPPPSSLQVGTPPASSPR